MQGRITNISMWFFGMLLFGSFAGTASAQEPAIRTAVRGDSVYVYHTVRQPIGHGFNVYRQTGSGDFEVRNEEPVGGISSGTELPDALGDRYETVRDKLDQSGPAQTFYALRADRITGLLLTFAYPEVARALGRLYVDHGAPVGDEVTYRVEFVDDLGNPTGEVLEETVYLEAPPLDPPTDLHAENEGRRVTLEWSYPGVSMEDDDKIIRFNVLRAVDGGPDHQVNGQTILVRNNAQSTFSYSFVVPQSGQEERFYVTAVAITGEESAPSEELSFLVEDNVAPRVVTGVEAFQDVEETIVVSWPVSTEADAAGYNIYRAKRSMTGTYNRLNDQPLGLLENVYRDSTVAGRRTFFYKVAAVDSTGNEGELSNAVMAQVSDNQPPPPPADLSAVPQDDGSVELTWSASDAPTDLLMYEVLRRRMGVGSGQAHAHLTNPGFKGDRFVDSGIEEQGFVEGAHYYFGVAAVDSSQNRSDTVSVMVQIPDVTAPAPPTDLQAFNDGGLRVNLRWNRSQSRDAAAYRVYRLEDEGADTVMARLPASRTFVQDNEAVAGGTYRYAVSAVDSVGNEGVLSDVVELLMQDYTPPQKVYNVQAQMGSQGVDLRWDSVQAADLDGYRIYRSDIPTGVYELVHSGLSSDTEWTDPLGEPGVWYRVRAVDQSGNESQPGDPAKAYPPPPSE